MRLVLAQVFWVLPLLGGCIDSETPLGGSKIDSAAPEDTGPAEDTGPEVDPEDSADTGDTEEPEPREGWFDLAVLDPPFLHGNAIWAGVAILDFDRDGHQDLFFTNGGNHPDTLYRNLGEGRFEDVAAEAGVDSTARHGAVVAGDIDNDGDSDLVVTTECTTGTLNPETGRPLGDGNITIYENRGDGTFLERQPALASGSSELGACPVSLELVDINQDGFPDLVYVNRNYNPSQSDPLAQVAGESYVWLSRPRDGNWPRVEVVGTDSNRQGLGTTLILDDGEKRVMHAMGIGGGTNSSSERAFLLGLGDAEAVRLEITFPSGEVVVLDEVQANQSIVVEEP